MLKQNVESGYKLKILITDEEQKIQFERTYSNLEDSIKTTNKIDVSYDYFELIIDIDGKILKSSGEDIIELNNENNIILNELDEEKIEAITQAFEKKLIGNLTQNLLETDNDILVSLGSLLEFWGYTDESNEEAKINTFNSKFEFYEGEDILGSNVKKLLLSVKENFQSYEVISSKEIKLNLKRDSLDEEGAIDTILKVIKDNRKYDIKIEYDDESGIISAVYIVIK